MSQPHEMLGLSSDNILVGSRTRRSRVAATAEPEAGASTASSAAGDGDAPSDPGATRRGTIQVVKPRAITNPEDIRRLGRELLVVLLNATAEDGTHLSDPFYLLPSRKLYPSYYTFIKHPISFNEVLARWRATGASSKRGGANGTAAQPPAEPYASFELLRKDCDLIALNAKRFNEKGSLVYERARQLTALIRDAYPELVISGSIPDVLQPEEIEFEPNDPHVTSKFVGDEESDGSSDASEDAEGEEGEEHVPARPASRTPAGAPHRRERKRARTQNLKEDAAASDMTPGITFTDSQLMQGEMSQDGQRRGRYLRSALKFFVKHLHEGRRPDGSSVAQSFEHLPARTDTEYYRRIAKPISLSEIDHKIGNKEYTQGWSLMQDLERMVGNALMVNPPGSLPWFDAYWIQYLIRTRAVPVFLREGFTLEKGDERQLAPAENRATDTSYYVKKETPVLPPSEQWLPPDARSYPLPEQYAHVPLERRVARGGGPAGPRASVPSSPWGRPPTQHETAPGAYAVPSLARAPAGPLSSTPVRPGSYTMPTRPNLPASVSSTSILSMPLPGTRVGAVPMSMPYKPRQAAQTQGDASAQDGTAWARPAPSPAPGQALQAAVQSQAQAQAQAQVPADRTSPEWWLTKLNPFAKWDEQLSHALQARAAACGTPAQGEANRGPEGAVERSASVVALENVVPYIVLDVVWSGSAGPGQADRAESRQRIVLDCDSAGTRQHLVQLVRPRAGDVLDAVEVRFFLRDLVARAERSGRLVQVEKRKPERERPTRRRAAARDHVAMDAQDKKASGPGDKDSDDARAKEKYAVQVAWCGRDVSATESVLSVQPSASTKGGEEKALAQTQWTSYSARLSPVEGSATHTLDVQVSNVPRLLPPPVSASDGKEEDGLPDEAKRLLALLPERYQVFIQLQD